MMYQRDMCPVNSLRNSTLPARACRRGSSRRNLTIVLKTASTPKKKMASMPVMIITMIAVVTVSLRVGQYDLAVFGADLPDEFAGGTFATVSEPLADRKTLREPGWAAELEVT